MDYRIFKEIVIEKILMCLPEGAWVEDVGMIKESRFSFSGISIIYPSKYMSPVLYLEPFFKMACQNVGLGQIVADILTVLKAAESAEGERPETLDWSNIQDKVYPRLMNYKKNQKFLSQVPHDRLLDLAVTYYIDIPMQSGVRGYMTVRMSLFEMWGIPLQELQEAALHNLRHNVVPDVVSAYNLHMAAMYNDMGQKGGGPDNTSQQDSVKGLKGLPDSVGIENLKEQYILAAPKFSYGAEILLCTYVLEELAEILHADLYLIPLAVDAVEMIPVGKGISPEEIYEEIKTVESMKEESVEFISGELYLYERSVGKIRLMD